MTASTRHVFRKVGSAPGGARNRVLKPISFHDYGGGKELGCRGDSGGSEAGEPSTPWPP